METKNIILHSHRYNNSFQDNVVATVLPLNRLNLNLHHKLSLHGDDDWDQHDAETYISIEFVVFSRQYDLLHVLGQSRYASQVDAVVCDAKQFVHHCLVRPLQVHHPMLYHYYSSMVNITDCYVTYTSAKHAHSWPVYIQFFYFSA